MKKIVLAVIGITTLCLYSSAHWIIDNRYKQVLSELKTIDPDVRMSVYLGIIEDNPGDLGILNQMMKWFDWDDGWDVGSPGNQKALDWARWVLKEKTSVSTFGCSTAIDYLIKKGDARDLDLIPFRSWRELLAMRVAGTNLINCWEAPDSTAASWNSFVPSVANTGPQGLYARAILRQFWSKMEVEIEGYDMDGLPIRKRDKSKIPDELLTLVVRFDGDGNPVCNVDLAKYGLTMPKLDVPKKGDAPLTKEEQRQKAANIVGGEIISLPAHLYGVTLLGARSITDIEISCKMFEEYYDNPDFRLLNEAIWRIYQHDGWYSLLHGNQETLDLIRKVLRDKAPGIAPFKTHREFVDWVQEKSLGIHFYDQKFALVPPLLYLVAKGDERDFDLIPIPAWREMLAARLAGTNLINLCADALTLDEQFIYHDPRSGVYDVAPSATNMGPQAYYVQEILRRYAPVDMRPGVRIVVALQIPPELRTMVVWFDDDGNPVCNVDLAKYGLAMPELNVPGSPKRRITLEESRRKVREYLEELAITRSDERRRPYQEVVSDLNAIDRDVKMSVYLEMLEEKPDDPDTVKRVIGRFFRDDGCDLTSSGNQKALDWTRKVLRNEDERFKTHATQMYLMRKGDARDLYTMGYGARNTLGARVAGTNVILGADNQPWRGCIPSVANTGPQGIYVEEILRQYWENMEGEFSFFGDGRRCLVKGTAKIPDELLALVVWFDGDGNPVCSVDLSKYGLTMPEIDLPQDVKDEILRRVKGGTAGTPCATPNRLWLYLAILCAGTVLFIAYKKRKRGSSR